MIGPKKNNIVSAEKHFYPGAMLLYQQKDKEKCFLVFF